MSLHLNDLKKLWGEPTCCNSSLNEPLGPVCTDSRLATKGCFFVPLIGKNFDGHQFIFDAFHAGAQVGIVSLNYSSPLPEQLTYWRVEDTLKAYQQLALLHRSTLDMPVIAITGSVGKTTTRELVSASLSLFGSVISTKDNNNNDIGVPLTLLQATSNHIAAVIEMGMRGLGEIKRLSYCANPDIAIITNIGNAHIGRLGSLRNIAIAKTEITSFLNPEGTVIIPANAPLLEDALKTCWDGKVLRVDVRNSLSENTLSAFNDGTTKSHHANYLGILDKSQTSLVFQDKTFQLPFPGMHIAKNFMFALTVAIELGYPISSLKKIYSVGSTGRNRCFRKGQITILDESYNASPESVKASLELLSTKSGRQVAVLGTMMELGEKSIELHREIVRKAVAVGLDVLIIFSEGLEAEVMLEEGSKLPYCSVHHTLSEVANELKNILRPGDNLLLKGSRVMGLERLIHLIDSPNKPN